jgi:hypothetical protein
MTKNTLIISEEQSQKNLEHFSEINYLLSFIDKIPLQNSCNPFIKSQDLPVPKYFKNYKVVLSSGDIVSSFITILFQKFNTKYSKTEWLLNQNNIIRAFFKDLEVNFKCKVKTINGGVLSNVAQRYMTNIRVYQLNGRVKEYKSTEDNPNELSLLFHSNGFHLLV